MKKSTFLILMLLLTAAFSSMADHLRNQILLSAKLDGDQENPAVSTTALGVASLSINATMDSICLSVSVTGLSGAITGAHIHSGAMGVNGPVLFDLTSQFTGNHATAIITGSDLTDSLLSEYLKGNMYLNVHTAANPNGEIRGQIYPESDIQFTAMLDGDQEVPAVTTSAMGLGTFTLSKNMGKLTFKVIADGLSDTISSAHFHTGSIGASGPVAIDLTSSINGNSISGEIDPSAILTDLMAGNIYINLHTSTNPNGEIRGQLMMEDKICFDAWIDGDQEVPAVSTPAMGVGDFKLNTTFDTLWYHVVMNDLSGVATGAHFHSGSVGTPGGVVLDLTDSINGNMISGMATGSTITPLISDMLKGELYINVHTAANPNGEIRGQIYRVLREGYSATIEGMQEVPAVTTNARGTLVASIDRDQTDLHFMWVADDITITGVHFHNEAEGQNGPVIFDMTSMIMNNGAFGYWKSTDTVPFTTAHSLMFRNDSVYINLHTSANPNGEIRGQVERGFYCFSITTSVEENSIQPGSANAYPNPAFSNLTISYSGVKNQPGKISVSDITGRVVLSTDVLIEIGNNKNMIEVGKLSPGYYLISITSGGSTEVVLPMIKE